MSPQQIPRVKALLFEALQLEPSLREDFLNRYSGATPSDIEQVRNLLAAQETAASRFDDLSFGPDREAELLVQPGELISGRYRIIRLLQSKPRTQVYLAEDERLAQGRVVVKFPDIQASHADQVQDQLWAEIEALAKLRHPSVCGLIDTGFHLHHCYLVTEYVEGLHLDEWVENFAPSLDTRTALFLHLLSIVEAIHSRNLLHLDLKPDNIVVHSSPAAAPALTILDFGTARAAGQTRLSFAATPRYAAPERLEGQATFASDVYSLGRIGLDLLAGTGSRNRQLLERTLDDDPQQRPRNAGDFRQALVREIQRTKQTRTLLQAACLSLFLAAAGLALWFALRQPPLVPALNLREITSLRGSELDPALSPDGNTVYFAHISEPKAWTAIYKVEFAGGLPEPVLGPTPGIHYRKPKLSPDGKQLALLADRGRDGRTILLHNLEGGPPRHLLLPNPQSFSFSPDGQHLYVVDEVPGFPRGQLKRITLATGKIEALPSPPAGYRGDVDVSVSPDGRMLAFSRFRTLECGDVYILPLETGPAQEPVKITSRDQRVHHPQWLPDSRQLIFTAGTLTSTSPFLATLQGSLTDGARVEALAAGETGLGHPATARYSRRIVLAKDREDSEIYRLTLGPQQKFERFLTSTQLDEEPRYSPDGQAIAFLSERAGDLQGWIAPRDQVSRAQMITRFDRGEKAWPAWGTAGSAFFFARLPQVGPEVLEVPPPWGSGLTRRVFSGDRAIRVSGMGVDGRSVFITVEDETSPRLERWSMESDRREVIAPVRARFVREFVAGRHQPGTVILFGEPHEERGLFLVDQGQPRQIYPSLARRNTFAYHEGFAYLASNHPRLGIYKVNIQSGAATLLLPLDKNPGWGMDVSPDGKELLIALYDFEDSNIVGAELK